MEKDNAKSHHPYYKRAACNPIYNYGVANVLIAPAHVIYGRIKMFVLNISHKCYRITCIVSLLFWFLILLHINKKLLYSNGLQKSYFSIETKFNVHKDDALRA